MTHLKRVLGRTGLIQLDSVNVAVRAHFLPLFARLGPYDRQLLARAAWQPVGKPRALAEYWAHEAALIPVDDWPLFRWRMDEFTGGRWKYTREVMAANAALAADIVAVIDELGPSMPATSRPPSASCATKATPEAGGSAARSNTSARHCSPRAAVGGAGREVLPLL